MGYRNTNYLEEVFNEYNKNLENKKLNINETLEINTNENINPVIEESLTFDDWWGDTNNSSIGHTEGGLYYYYLNSQIIKSIINTDAKLRKMTLIPPVDAIQSVNIVPYLDGTDISAQLVTFDKTRMPIPTDTETSYITTPLLPRVKKLTLQRKQVGAFYRFKKMPNNENQKRNYLMESKLQIFPYTYGILADGISSPYEFRYELIENGFNVAQIYLLQKLTNQGTFFYNIEDYKGDRIGTLEGNFSNTPTNLPIVSNAYTNFMSSNQAQNRMQILNGAISGLKGAVIGGVAGFAAGGPLGAAVGAAGGGVSGAMEIGNAMAQRTDASTSPNTLKDSGSDIILKSFVNNGFLTHYRLTITDYYKEMLGDYFAMYGYKQNRVFTPNLNSRYYYNFVRTVNCNINGVGVPKEHLNKLKAIYNNGTTIWHIDNSGVIIGDYQYDNKENELF